MNIHTGTCQINGTWQKDRSICNSVRDQILAGTSQAVLYYDHQPTQLYRVNIGPVQVGDVFEILSSVEFTNDQTYAVVTGTTVIASANPNQTINYVNEQYPLGTDYTLIPQGNTNLSHETHHGIHTQVGGFLVDQAMKNYYGNNDVWVIMLGWTNVSYQTLASGVYTVTIEHGDGALSVFKR